MYVIQYCYGPMEIIACHTMYLFQFLSYRKNNTYYTMSTLLHNNKALQAVYSIDGKSTSICKTVLIEKFLVIEYLFLNGSVVKALDS